MAWTATHFAGALAAEWVAQAPKTNSITRSLEVEQPSSAMPAIGIANRDVRRVNMAGTSSRGDSSLVLQEVADLYKAFTASATDEDDESFESFLAVSTGGWWWGVFEVSSNPSSAANITLTWLEPTGAGHTKTATKSVTNGNSAALTAAAIVTQLETITWSTDATRKVVNGHGSMFRAWATTGGSASKDTVVIAALSSRQTFAKITSAFSTNDIAAAYNYGTSSGALLVNRIRDLRHPWTSAMTSEVATVDQANAASGTTAVIPTREDIDLQESLFRSSKGANMATAGKILHQEVIAPAVHRTCIIEINYTDFKNNGSSEALFRTIALPFPFTDRLGFDYYSEGPPIITDAFLEHHTNWQVDTSGSQSGTYPSLSMDIGITNPVLDDGSAAGRLSGSAVLRRQRVTCNATIGQPPEAGLQGLNNLYAGAEVYHGSVISAIAGGATSYVKFGETEQYPATDHHTGSGAIPPYLTFSERFVITAISFELPSSTAYTYSAQNFLSFQLLVCPPAGNPVSGFVPVGNYIDLTAEPYDTNFDATGLFKPGSLAASTTTTELLGCMIPKDWKLAIKVAATGTVITRGWTVRVHGYLDRGKGALLQSSTSSLAPDVWSGRADTLTADLMFEAKTELGITEPGGTTYAMASLDQGKSYLHIHFWQPRRRAAAQAASTP